MENIGWIGSFLLAICGFFEAFKSWKQGESHLSWGFIISWLVGEILLLVYILPKMDFPLIFNYSSNIMFVAVILNFKLHPRD